MRRRMITMKDGSIVLTSEAPGTSIDYVDGVADETIDNDDRWRDAKARLAQQQTHSSNHKPESDTLTAEQNGKRTQ